MEARVDPNRESKARVKPAPKPKNEQPEPSKEYPSTKKKKKEEKLGHVSRERSPSLRPAQQSSCRLLYDGLPSFLGSARSSTLRPSKFYYN